MSPATPEPSILWIDWGRHLRTRSLAARLGVELIEIPPSGGRIRRYLHSIRRTLARLGAARPRVVIATNPSLVLGILLWAMRRHFGYALVADAHYLGVRSLAGSGLLQRLLDFYNARADLVIVTNEPHARYVRDRGGRAYVCPDPLPQLPAPEPPPRPVPDRSVFLVCSFDADEPYEAVFTAIASLCARGYSLYVSGNHAKASLGSRRLAGVNLLGFVPERQFYAYMRACTLVMDLTTLEDCLVCGAYEALSARKPLIVSDTAALREYFGAAALVTGHAPEEIAASVERAYAEREDLARRADEWCARNEVYLDARVAGLRDELCGQALKGSRARGA